MVLMTISTEHYLPTFENKASCADYDPELWFPQEVQRNKKWSRTPDAMKARAICASCPALQECLDYALQFSGLYGIWAGQDWYERRELQEKLGILPTPMMDTYDSSAFRSKVVSDDDEW